MNIPVLPLLERLRTRIRIRLVGVAQADPASAPVRMWSGRSRRARGVVCWFAIGVLMLHLLTVLVMDVVRPTLRDPEYGRRAEALHARVVEHPDRPLVAIVGSSRVVWGVKPDVWEATRPGSARDPLLFNMGTLGAGPIYQLLTLRRLYADGFRPTVVLVEYWPPLLRQDGDFAETARFDPRRLRWDDRAVIRDYFPDIDATERRMWISRVNAISDNRHVLVVQTSPEWLVKPWLINGPWRWMDDWGWVPGMDPEDEAERRKLIEHQRPHYCDRLRGLTIHPHSDRALRETVALARSHGARVGFLFMPESAEFQSWYPPEVEAASRAHLTALSCELSVPVLDARNWMDECDLSDGFHLSRTGAARFTLRLRSAVTELFSNRGNTR